MTSVVAALSAFVSNLLESLGWKATTKCGTILLLGLDDAGKTTLLHRLRTDTILQYPPTERPNRVEHVWIPDTRLRLTAWDLGGHEAVRHLWEDYCRMDAVSAILFVIDAANPSRFDEIRDELDALLLGEERVWNDDDSNIPVAILLNKCDLEGALRSDIIADSIGFHDIVRQRRRDNNTTEEDNHNTWNSDTEEQHDNDEDGNHMASSICTVNMFRISVLKGEGYQEAFRWIATFL